MVCGLRVDPLFTGKVLSVQYSSKKLEDSDVKFLSSLSLETKIVLIPLLNTLLHLKLRSEVYF